MVKDHHMGNFPISSKGSFIYGSSHRQDNTYHGLCYTTGGALPGTRNSSEDAFVPWGYMIRYRHSNIGCGGKNYNS